GRSGPSVWSLHVLPVAEMENYRSAMSKMAEDIIALRTRVVTLEAENSRLHTDLSLQQDHGRDLLDDTDIDVMTKAEIADFFASLKCKLASETSKAASQRDRIQQLQNDLIKKNDSEKELMQLQRVHQSHLAEMATLVTVKQQEKVNYNVRTICFKKNKKNICRSQNISSDCVGETGPRKEERELAPAAENSRLRGELDRIRQEAAPLVIQQIPQVLLQSIEEKLSLLNKLEMAEARVRTLEAQLEENCKLWGRQKQEMMTELSEHRHGFVRTSTTILHHVPSVS
uniref:Coiled-coil domain containing 33 n=1 Tax=Cyclopterus lumpus TaxID=8103 RepID=A0A8C2WBC3_CYCLU